MTGKAIPGGIAPIGEMWRDPDDVRKAQDARFAAYFKEGVTPERYDAFCDKIEESLRSLTRYTMRIYRWSPSWTQPDSFTVRLRLHLGADINEASIAKECCLVIPLWAVHAEWTPEHIASYSLDELARWIATEMRAGK